MTDARAWGARRVGVWGRLPVCGRVESCAIMLPVVGAVRKLVVRGGGNANLRLSRPSWSCRKVPTLVS